MSKAATDEVIVVLNVPDIPGLTFRRFRGTTDYPHMVAILNGCSEADDYEYANTIEEMSSCLHT